MVTAKRWLIEFNEAILDNSHYITNDNVDINITLINFEISFGSMMSECQNESLVFQLRWISWLNLT